MNMKNIGIILILIMTTLCGMIGILFLIGAALIMINGGCGAVSFGIVACVVVLSLTGGALVYISITEWISSLVKLIRNFKERCNK